MNQLRTSTDSMRSQKSQDFNLSGRRGKNGKAPLKRRILEENLIQRVERSGEGS